MHNLQSFYYYIRDEKKRPIVTVCLMFNDTAGIITWDSLFVVPKIFLVRKWEEKLHMKELNMLNLLGEVVVILLDGIVLDTAIFMASNRTIDQICLTTNTAFFFPRKKRSLLMVFSFPEIQKKN